MSKGYCHYLSESHIDYYTGIKLCLVIVIFIIKAPLLIAQNKADHSMSRYNVIWNSPSKNASGVMPIGNGDIAAGVYAIENGDLYLLLSKNDAYTYMGDIFKTGRIRISISPNPFISGKPFRQTLNLTTGSIDIEADGTIIKVWADANHPVFHIEIKSQKNVAASVYPDLWNRIDHTSYNNTKAYTAAGGWHPNEPATQDIVLQKKNKIIWYYAVGNRSTYTDDLKFYNVEGMAAKFADPFRYNTFGNLLACPQMSLSNGILLVNGKSFDIRVFGLTMQTPDSGKWIAAIEDLGNRKIDLKNDWENHCKWWTNFWNKSWIIASDNTIPANEREKLSGEVAVSGKREEKDGAALTSQSYNVFRFLMACQSRGKVQTKFNGGIFTQQLRTDKNDKNIRSARVLQADSSWLINEDDRLWGRRFTFQNQRLLYWPLLASGDFDLMKPFFSYYTDMLEMRKAITKAWFGHEGAYYRENIEPTGAEQDIKDSGHPPLVKPNDEGWYTRYYYTSGLETIAMMLDKVNYTNDTAFAHHTLVPFAREVLLFYDKHYQRKDGKLYMEPANSLETWWIAVNPAPDLAGLRYCINGLLKMKAGSSDDQYHWAKLLEEMPDIPMQTIDGKLAIAPAQDYVKKRKNLENAELYPVFPFRCYGIALGNADIVNQTMQNRTCKDVLNDACWTQDQIHWAYAGNAGEAAIGLVRRFRIASKKCRFPMYGEEGPDSCPDFDHFGSGSIALQRMLLQEENGKILLFPAWPKEWDLTFKLHAMNNTTVEGEVKKGKVISIKVIPEYRRKDLVFAKGWEMLQK